MQEYINIKNGQIMMYRKEAKRFNIIAAKQLIFIVLGFLHLFSSWFLLGFFIESGWYFGLALWAVSIPIVAIGEAILCKIRRSNVKSALLLHQLINALENVLRSNRGFDDMKQSIAEIETKFLANDDELWTKKYVWPFLLEYKREKMHYYETAATGVTPRPRHLQVPPVWLDGDPLRVNYKDRSLIKADWSVRQMIRRLYFVVTYREKFQILTELDSMVKKNEIVFERFLRHKKISKLLKYYKTSARIAYLRPAFKMRLIEFVNSVISERIYTADSESMQELLGEKNAQIHQYTEDFWKVHRRSLKYYVFEALWLGWMIPFGILSVLVWDAGIMASALVFLAGAALVVYGEMVLVTRQMIDMKGKKLMPSLIASLIAIRHSMCCESAEKTEKIEKYRKAFKDAEKHFILATTEIESVKYVQENLKDKIMRLDPKDLSSLKEEKKKQLKHYYEEFHHYRRWCLRFGALEAFVALLAIPIVAFAFWFSYLTGIYTVDLFIIGAYVIIGGITEIVLIYRHILVGRRKELYLLLYQELAVILADPYKITDCDALQAAFQNAELSTIHAAESDKLKDVADHIKSVIYARESLEVSS